jgi:RND family efflux transporter MFP subunit
MPGIILSLCFLLLYPSSVYAQHPSPGEQPRTFTLLPARKQVLLTGFTRARATLDISSEVPGRCLEITADVGEAIKNDGIFAVIDSTLIGLELQANEIDSQQVRRQILYESQQVKRYRQLLSSKSSSKVRLDELKLQLDQSRLKLDQLQVEQKRLQELLSRHQVKAPAGWWIIERHVEPGQWIAGGQVLAKAGDYRTLLVPLAVTPAELGALKQEQTIALHLPEDDIDGQGTLFQISPGFDPHTRKIRLAILLDQPTYDKISLKQGGVRVEVPILMPDPMHAFLVPAPALVERYEDHWLTRQDGSRVRVIVLGPTIGPDKDKEWIRITSADLKTGDIFSLPPAEPKSQ